GKREQSGATQHRIPPCDGIGGEPMAVTLAGPSGGGGREKRGESLGSFPTRGRSGEKDDPGRLSGGWGEVCRPGYPFDQISADCNVAGGAYESGGSCRSCQGFPDGPRLLVAWQLLFALPTGAPAGRPAMGTRAEAAVLVAARAGVPA